MHDLLDMFFQGASPSNFLVNFLPILKHLPDWMPGASFKTFARKARDIRKLALDAPFEWVKNEMVRATNSRLFAPRLSEILQAKGTAEPSYVSQSLLEADFTGEGDLSDSRSHDLLKHEDLVLHIAGAMFGGKSHPIDFRF
jgi:hypothetical protein